MWSGPGGQGKSGLVLQKLMRLSCCYAVDWPAAWHATAAPHHATTLMPGGVENVVNSTTLRPGTPLQSTTKV